MVWITPDRAHAALHIRIEGLAALDRLLLAEDHLVRFRRELPAGLGSAGLHDHRPALDRPRDVEWSTHREVRPLMIEHMQLVRIEIDAGLDVAHEGIVGPDRKSTRLNSSH